MMTSHTCVVLGGTTVSEMSLLSLLDPMFVTCLLLSIVRNGVVRSDMCQASRMPTSTEVRS